MSYGSLSFPTICIKRSALFIFFKLKNRVEKTRGSLPGHRKMEKETTNTCKRFLESQQLAFSG